MSLRVRLVAALAVLLAVGIVGYGVVTYRAFAAGEQDRLDLDLRAAVPDLSRELDTTAGRYVVIPVPGPPGLGSDGAGGPGGGPDGAPLGNAGLIQGDIPPGTWAQLRDADGEVLSTRPSDRGTPDLADVDVPDDFVLLTLPSADDDGERWRTVVERRTDGTVLLAAVPMGQLDETLRELLLIEVVGGVILVLLLAGGAWLVLRAGLRPLDAIAATATSITAGSIDTRVPSDDRDPTETRQVAEAINGMLEDLQGAFAERDATEAKLRRFVADASHELRTPLTSIQGYAELFRLGADSPHVDTPTILRRVEQEATRMRQMVEDLLTLARLDEPRPLATAPVDLTVVAADACSDAVALDPDRPVSLDAPTPVVVEGDESRLRQAVTNLVANALRHTPAGTALEVATAVEGDVGVLRVTDHGPGLPAGAAAQVFDRFWQADAARTGEGAGLGLSIVAAVAEAHGGRAVAGDAPHGGATFTITIPLHAPDAQGPIGHEEPTDVG